MTLIPTAASTWRQPWGETVYGDVNDLDLVGSLPLHGCPLVVSTLPSTEANLALYRHLHDLGYDGRIALLARTARDADRYGAQAPIWSSSPSPSPPTIWWRSSSRQVTARSRPSLSPPTTSAREPAARDRSTGHDASVHARDVATPSGAVSAFVTPVSSLPSAGGAEWVHMTGCRLIQRAPGRRSRRYP